MHKATTAGMHRATTVVMSYLGHRVDWYISGVIAVIGGRISGRKLHECAGILG